MVTCPRCGASRGDSDRFCEDCGAPLGRCPSCGELVTPGKPFCRSCGHQLPDLAPAMVPALAALDRQPDQAPVAERRVCSVLFCDLVGFTPLSEARDAEAVRELLSRYFEVARTIIGRYGGVVEKFIGDAVMAVWGTPVATEEDAERAVRAALDLVSAVAELGAAAQVPGLAARAGVVTGEVAVSLGASGQGMVAGDAVNTAARVQAAAGPGRVLADEATQRLAASAIGFASAGEHALKGKAEPARLWQATRVLAAVGGVQRVDGLEAPLTGRDAELRTIRELFHATADRRLPRLVLVSGPAGVGKSRLGWEFEKYADGLALDVWWHRGRCLSYGEGVAFWALAEIVRQRLGIAEEDLAEAATAKLAAGLDRFVPDPAERAYIGPRLARLLGAGPGGPALAREELFAGWRLFFERLAAVQPVVLLVEDAQYADSGLLDFLDYLVDWVRDLPVYVLVFARPELGEARPRFGTGRNRTMLTVDPLDAGSMDALVDALVPGMPAAARAKIAGQAQGIPLFAVETVRALIDRDVVRPVEGVYRLAGDIGELAVPDSLHALLAARLDALDPWVRLLVADAAVLGSTFPAEALVATSGQDEPRVRSALDDLVRRGVLSVSADPLSPERGSYAFAQEMLRQVAYDTLSRRDRKTRHLTVAAHLRAVFAGDGEEVADAVARHYLDALHAVPDDPDAPQIRDQAIAALTRAAERAGRIGAPAWAAGSYAAAAELASSDAAASLWERAAEAADINADWARAGELATRASGCYRRAGQARAAARAQAIAGNALRMWGRIGEAREQLTAALEVLRAEPDTDTVRAAGHLAIVEAYDASADADRVSAEALTLGQALGVTDDELSDLFRTRGMYFVHTNRYAEAASYYRESARLAEQAGDSMRLGRAMLNLADALLPTDPGAAAQTARAAAGQLRRVGDRGGLAIALINLCEALLMLGDWDAAEEELARAADSDALADNDFLVAERCLVAALRGDTAAAQAMLATLTDLRGSENAQDLAMITEIESLIAVARGEPRAVLRHTRATLAHAPVIGLSSECLRWAWPLAARAAYELRDAAATGELLALLDATSPGHLPPMLHAERDLARARLAASDGTSAAEGEQAFTAALGRLREQSTPYHVAHGLLDYAAYLAGAGGAAAGPDGAAAAAVAVEEALHIGRRLRCQPLLDRAAETARTELPATP